MVSGEELVRAWQPDSGFAKEFCSECGSQLWSRDPDDPEVISVRLGRLRQRPGHPPAAPAVRRLRGELGGDPGRRASALRRAAAQLAIHLPFSGSCAILNSMVQYPPTVDRAFTALADPTRRAVLERLGSGSATISELAEPFGMSLTGMKKHVTAARGGGARHDGEGRPRPQVHARALRLRGDQHVAAAARPLRAGRRTNERRTMSTEPKKESRNPEASLPRRKPR